MPHTRPIARRCGCDSTRLTYGFAMSRVCAVRCDRNAGLVTLAVAVAVWCATVVPHAGALSFACSDNPNCGSTHGVSYQSCCGYDPMTMQWCVWCIVPCGALVCTAAALAATRGSHHAALTKRRV